MEFLEWLTDMGLMFYGWIFPIGFGVNLIIEKGSIFVGILICLTSVPIEILLYHLHKKIDDKVKKKEREEKETREQEQLKAEKARQERIKASPIKNLTPLQFEEFTKLYLEERNYKQVQLTSKSGDFGADVLALAPDNKKICVQCKLYSKPVGVSAIQEIHSAKSYYRCNHAAVVTTSAGYTRQAIKLSEEVCVYLFAFDDYTHTFKPVNYSARSYLQDNH